MKIWKNFDIFSQQFFFNIEDQNLQKKSTFLGFCLSVIVFIIILAYFSYLLVQFSNNQIQPFFRQQSFIDNRLIETPLNNNLVAFKMDSGDFVYQPNKTYLVVMAYFYQQKQNTTFIPLDVIDCTSQDLQGYKCLDFSNVSNYTFALNTQENLYSQIQIFIYGCRDIDKVKTTIPDDCATQDEINTLVNGVNVGLRYKLYTAQYNTTSQQMQSDYRNILVYTFASQAIVTFLNMQTQTTNVKQGLIWQQNSYYSSPLQYGQINQSMDRISALNDGQGPFNSFVLQMDEIVYQIQIQYITLPQILAFVNGVFSLLMIIGYVGRKYSQKQINEHFVMLFLENIFPAQYFKMFKANDQHLCNQNTITQYQENKRNTLEKKQNKFDVQENTVQNQNESDNTIYLSKQENTFVNCIYSIENEQNDQVNHLPNFEVKLKGSLQFSQSNQIKFNPFDISNLQTKPSSLQNKSKKYDQENILKLNDESQLKDEQLFFQFQESNNQSQNQSFIQQQSFQKTCLQNFQHLNDTNQSCLQKNSFNVSPILKDFDYKNQLKTKSSAENCQKKTQTRSPTQNQSLYLIGKADKQKVIQIDNISKENLEKITKHDLCSKRQEVEPLELNTQQKNIIHAQIANDLNIFSLYKDIIFLKKAMMILFNHEQLAAIKTLGCSSNYLSLIRNNIDLDLQKINQLRNKRQIFQMSSSQYINPKNYSNSKQSSCQQDSNKKPILVKQMKEQYLLYLENIFNFQQFNNLIKSIHIYPAILTFYFNQASYYFCLIKLKQNQLFLVKEALL
ncbi:transmembrane protein, putative (macronuclear) [Tetrahymena thermophila SB210]|uniref:Transmembrane protein, putative n=1 Tax=Tetrahymena thermophila (strain SB210) TaxID=312017 RepID=A4VF26_TETTS|nr:transmembrane protein, putative [Tetrahymena thermophila SB210]EDK31220.2 transmembrane protein, putative [Tetrahymena thermophila SB210]|eukprot:XP_001470658.2 transmembrane protein, putative [Tetrahymena thermophila SB210]